MSKGIFDSNGICDGSHWGLTDWYKEKEIALEKAIKKGNAFTTNWYSSKKELASAKIDFDGESAFTVSVSVFDDLDTEGMAVDTFFCNPHSNLAEIIYMIKNTIDRTWGKAIKNQKENQMYMGFSILHKSKVYGGYVGGKGIGKPQTRLCWVETYLKNTHGLDSPTGDCYSQWGFQDEIEIPVNVKNKLSNWAENWNGEKQYRYKEWVIKPWEKQI